MDGDVVNSNGMNRDHERITAGSNDDVFNDDDDDEDDEDNDYEDEQHFNMMVESLTYQRFCQCRRQFINRRIDDNQLISLLVDHFLACQGSRHLLTGSSEQAHLDAPSSETASSFSAASFLKVSVDRNKDKSGSVVQIQKELNGFTSTTMLQPQHSLLNNHGRSRAPSNSESSCCSNWDEDVKSSSNVAQTFFPLLCQICGAFCMSDMHFKQHVSDHVTSTLYPFQCIQCNHKFTNQCALEAHCLSAHNTSAQMLPANMLATHERRFECEICGARFKQQRVLQQHMDGMHSEEQRYNCPCGQRFRWPAKFYQHKRVCVIASLGKKIEPNDSEQLESSASASAALVPSHEVERLHHLQDQLQVNTEETISDTIKFNEQVPSRSTLEPILDLRIDNGNSGGDSAGGAGGKEAVVDAVLQQKSDGEPDEVMEQDEDIIVAVAASSPVLSPSSTALLCPECGAATDSMSELDDHIDSEHASSGTFACLCGQTWDWKPQYLRHLLQCEHVLQHSTWRADSDNDGTAADDEELLDVDAGETTDVDMKDASLRTLETTTVVRRTPKQASKLERMTLGSGAGERTGNKSAATTTRSSAAKPRFRINYDNQEKPYECVECQKCFRTKTLLDQHGHLHMPPKYQCRYCAKRYRWPPVFYSHQRSCKYQFTSGLNGHSSSSPNSTASHLPTALLMAGVLAPGAKDAAIEKDVADFTLTSDSVVEQCAQPQQQSSKIRLPLSYSDYVCACGGKFQSYRSYTAHMAECPAVAGPAAAAAAAAVGFIGQQSCAPGSALVAAVAAADLNSSQSFSAGLESGDKQERHVCPQCGKTYSSKFSLKQHIDGMHSAEGKFECPTCKKRFRWGASYYYHKKACGAGGVGAGGGLLG